MDKKVKKFDDTEIEEYKSGQYKSPISINDIDMVTKIIKKLDLYAYSFQKRVYIKDILIRLNVCML